MFFLQLIVGIVGCVIFFVIVWLALVLLFKVDDRATSFLNRKIVKIRRGKKKPRLYPKVSYNLQVEGLGMLHSNYFEKEDADKVLKSLPFLKMKPFRIHAEEINPETREIVEWRRETGFSLWLVSNCLESIRRMKGN